MKAKELMIGDWVMYRNQPRQVVYIYCRPLADGTNHANEIGFTYDEDEWVNADHVEPIPLTAEILEKNGFSQSYAGWLVKKYGAWDISVYLSDYAQIEITNYCGRGTDCQEVNYGSTIEFDHNASVHELQHALRLCGLNELADNFKVE